MTTTPIVIVEYSSRVENLGIITREFIMKDMGTAILLTDAIKRVFGGNPRLKDTRIEHRTVCSDLATPMETLGKLLRP